MHTICFVEGACKECGCATTALQMSSEACEGNCYPKMINEKRWKEIKVRARYGNNLINFINNSWRLKDNKFIKLYEKLEN